MTTNRIYDGHEPVPVIPKGMVNVPVELQWAITDRLGWKVPYEHDPKTYIDPKWQATADMKEFAREQIEIGKGLARKVKAALRRLDAAWKKQI